MSQRIGHRLLAVFATLHDLNFRAELFFPELLAKLLHFVLPQRDYDLSDLTIPGKNSKRVKDDGRAIDFQELFGGSFFARCSHACPEPGGGYDDDHLHRREKYSNFKGVEKSGGYAQKTTRKLGASRDAIVKRKRVR